MRCNLPAVALLLTRGRSDEVTELQVLDDGGHVQNMQMIQ
jgi:hypothetical protein